jgi:hypothetical protein
MSREVLFWKEGPTVSASRGAIALALGEYEIDGLDPIDEARLIGAIDRRFPGWREEQIDRWKFECDIQSTFMTLDLHGGTPAEVEEWFRELAGEEGLSVFDFEADPITAADQRGHRKMIAAARLELQAEEEAEARSEFQGALVRAESGDPAAQFQVGQKLSFGEGVKRDPAAAASWYERAARAGNVDAMVNLAALYRSGRGVPRDPAVAVAWLERALPHDGLFAAFELGQLYAAGEGAPRDRRRAEELFQSALANGHPEARKALRLLKEAR